MMKTLILGAGGHAQVVADILRLMSRVKNRVEIVGYLDDDLRRHGRQLLGATVLGPVRILRDIPHDAVIAAVGDNRIRAAIFERLSRVGERFAVARHPHAIVASDVTVGDGSMICAGAIVNPGSVIGQNVILNTACSVDHHATIGNHVHIAPGVRLGGDVTVGDRALIGIGAVVLPRIQIGADSTVGAGAVVTAHVPAGATVVGAPARPIRAAAGIA